MSLQVTIVSPNRRVYQGAAEYLIAPGVHGNLGIMPGHTPMFAELRKGDIYMAGAAEQVFSIESGVLKVRADMVTILVGLEEIK